MGLHDDEAYVITTYKLGEADRIVVFFTQHAGLKRGVAKGARRMKSRFGGTLEPLSKVNLVYFETEGRELVSISSAEILVSPLPLLREETASFYLAYFAETVLSVALERDPLETLYRLLDATLAAAHEGAPFAALRSYFEVWALNLAGIFPSTVECAGCGRPLSERGEEEHSAIGEGGLRELRFLSAVPGFAHPGCGGGVAVPAEAWRTLRRALSLAPARFAAMAHAPGALAALSESCKILRRDFLGKELKSWSLLEAVHEHA